MIPAVPNKPNRPINTDLGSHRIVWEYEHVVRWPFFKVLREFSTLREFYPEISKFHEAYKVRDNTWAIYTDSFSGTGDPWMFVINGPKKALVVDTGYGIGDLRGLAEKLTGKKDILCCVTHHHLDHAYGNFQFDQVYCHEDEVEDLKATMRPDIWDFMLDPKTDKPLYTEGWTRDDIVEFKEYEILPLKSNEMIDLGDGYLVEIIPLRGHCKGMSGYLDHQTGCIFTGDLISAEPVEMLRDDLYQICQRMDEISGVFHGHGMFDQTPVTLQYHYNAAKAICDNPENADEKSVITLPDGTKQKYYKKYVLQATNIKYNPDKVTYEQTGRVNPYKK